MCRTRNHTITLTPSGECLSGIGSWSEIGLRQRNEGSIPSPTTILYWAWSYVRLTICIYLKIKKMKVEFEQQDVKTILYDSFCNGGLSELRYASVSIDWSVGSNKINYSEAKKRLLERISDDSICYEDVMMEILSVGDSITFTDYEGEENYILTLKSAMNILNSLEEESKKDLITILTDECNCDAWTYYNGLQLAMFGDIVYC